MSARGRRFERVIPCSRNDNKQVESIMFRILATVAAALGISLAAQAQTYPGKVVRKAGVKAE